MFLCVFQVRPLEALSHCIVWHQFIGAPLATAGSFISLLSVDDAAYSTFSLPAGEGDNDLFAISNGNELLVGSSALSAGSYSMTIMITGGGATYSHNATIKVLTQTSRPRLTMGWLHGAALNDQGELYVWGQGNQGQLGLGNTSAQSSPTQVPASSFGSQEVIDVKAHQHKTYVLTRTGQSYITDGSGNFSAHSLPERAVRIAVNIRGGCSLLESGVLYSNTSIDPGDSTGKLVIDLDSQREGMCFLTADGGLYEKRTGGSLTSVNSGIKKVFSAQNDSAFVLTDGDLIESYRYNYFGQLGLGDTTDRSTFTAISASNFGANTPVFVVSGYRHTVAIMSSQEIYGWGQNASSVFSSTNSNAILPSPTFDVAYQSESPIYAAAGYDCTIIVAPSGLLKGYGNSSSFRLAGDGMNLGDVTEIADTILPSETAVSLVTTATFNVTWNTYAIPEELLHLM